ncbi:MAG: endolytic transglycosylase MltG [Acidimicrobiales bacterium]
MSDDRYPGDQYASDEYADEYDDYGEYEPLRPSSRRGSPLAVTAVAVFAVLGILVAGTLVWASRQMNPSGDPGPKLASVVIPAGSTFDDVAQILEDRKVIGSARVLGWYAKFNDVNPVKAGRYVNFQVNSSMSDAVKVLNAGPVPPKDQVLTIIPGTWLEDALAAINKKFPNISVDALKLVLVSGQVTSKYHPDPKASWEGYLLPETYQFDENATAQQILQKLISTFDSTLDELGYGNATATTGRSAADLVTIASMVERETGDPDEERPKIARVIFNRLDRKIATGVDATILYGLHRKGNEKPLTKSELETDGPYNSRTRPGLPPTAISLPSKKSLDAAIHPATGNWLYYVLKTQQPRAHVFLVTYKEFEAAKAECQANGFC